MIRITISDNVLTSYYNLVKKFVLKKKYYNLPSVQLQKSNYKRTYQYVQNIIVNNQFFVSLEDMVKADPSKLFVLSNMTHNKEEKLINLYNQISKSDEFKSIIQSMNVKSCPYCNRNFIEVINLSKSNSKYRTSQMDHFYDKSNHSLLAISFFNLIPVCSVCNHTKSNSTFNVNPYSITTNEYFEFGIHLSKTNYLDEEALEITLSGNHNRLQDLRSLHLEELYQLHKNVVCDLLAKKKIYTDSIITELSNNLSKIGYSKRTIENLIFDMEIDEKEILQTPLSKLKLDLCKIIE